MKNSFRNQFHWISSKNLNKLSRWWGEEIEFKNRFKVKEMEKMLSFYLDEFFSFDMEMRWSAELGVVDD